jgi:WD40 repeat protein
LLCLASDYEEQGEYERALRHARRMVELDPWQGRAQRAVMRLLALNGQRVAALAHYESYRQELAEELNTQPSKQTRELYECLREERWPSAAIGGLAPPARKPKDSGGECPYRGLGTFREQDSPFFFGRERFTLLLRDAVERRPFVAVIGSSGSGKSSVVFAGLLPQLRDDVGDAWLITSCRPGEQPFHALAAALLPLLEPPSTETDHVIEARKLAAAWLEGDQTLLQTVGRVEENHRQEPLLLVIDQFEELYTLCPEPERRQRFLDLLLAAGRAGQDRPASPFGLLVTLRADFMGQALAYRPFADALQAGSLLLGPMHRDELRAAVARPAQKQGAAFEPGLVDRILDDVGEEPGNLPLLEFALTLLWDRSLTHETYEALGGVEGALARYAEQVFSDLDAAEQSKVPRILTQLVQPGEGTGDTRRAATRAQVGEANWPLTRRLADKRLVVTGRNAAGNEIVELAHEALIENWGRLQDWLEADRAFRTWQERLRAALRQWEVSGKDEGALLHGAPLAQAEEWLAAQEDMLSQAEKTFIRASISLRERRKSARDAQRQRQLAAERCARRLFGALAGVLAVATVVALILTFFSVRQRRQALEAHSLSLAANARQVLNDGDATTGLALAMAANRITDPPREAQRLLLEAAYSPGARWRAQVESLFEGTMGPATALDIGPDGRTALTGLADGSIAVWNLDTKAEIARLRGHTAQVNAVVIGPGGGTALSGGDDGRVIMWDISSAEALRRLDGHTGVVRAVDIGPGGRTAVSGGFAGESVLEPGELILWNLETGQEKRRFVGHAFGVVAAEFTPDGSALLASSGDAEVFSEELSEDTAEPGFVAVDFILWNVRTGEIIRRLEAMVNDAYSLSISPEGHHALAGSFYNNVLVRWDLGTGERIETLEGHEAGVREVSFGPHGRRAVSVSDDDSVILWDLSSAQPLARLNAHRSNVLALALVPDGRTALSSSRDGGVIVWDLVDAAEMGRLAGHEDMVWDVALTPDGEQALSSSGAASPSVPVQDASIRLWNLETGEQTEASELPVDVIFQVAISPDGRTALVATNEPFIRVWDLSAWQEVGRLEGHAGPVTGVEFTPDSERALSVCVDGTLILWDIPRRQIIHRFGGHGQDLWAVTISPDGRTAVSDSGDSSMVLWDLETGQEIRSFVREDRPAKMGSSGHAFLPDGGTVLSCEGDGFLIEWDLETGREVRRLGQHAGLRTRVVVSPDGRLALSGSMNGSLMLWDLESGELIRRSEGHGTIFDMALAPDGQSVFFGSSDTTIVQWRFDAPSFDELRTWVAANRYLPGLTCAERETYLIEPLCESTGER